METTSSPVEFEESPESVFLGNDTSPTSQEEQNRKKPKRNQVPKACSNCRKNHAGCDLQRPCKRCIQQGIESTCVDVPRKKRVSKQKEKPKEASPLESLSVELPDMDAWKETYEELFGTDLSNDIPENVLKELNPSESIFLTAFQPQPTPSPPPPPVPNDPNTELLQELVHQMNELKNSNRVLEHKLNSVTGELEMMKFENKRLSMISNWHSFEPADQLAVSTWKKITGSCKNVLVECNQRFVDLLGYPMEILQNHFTCDRLLPNSDCQPKPEGFSKCTDIQCKDFTKRTQILTNYGSREVFMTLTPIKSPNGTYFLLTILPVLQ